MHPLSTPLCPTKSVDSVARNASARAGICNYLKMGYRLRADVRLSEQCLTESVRYFAPFYPIGLGPNPNLFFFSTFIKEKRT